MLVLERFLPYRLNRIAGQATRRFARVYKQQEGLSVPEWRILVTLGEENESTSTALVQQIATHKTKVSRAVKRLEKRGWITRRTDETDRRIEHLSLTSAGARAYNGLVPKVLSEEEALLAQLGAEDRAALNQGLRALETVLVEHGEVV
ncbi:MAG: MarR family transcriptional regulator [Pseudomonadota bacterium]